MERLTITDKKILGGKRMPVIDSRAVMYWALKAYEDTGLTPEQIQEIDKLYAEKCRELEEVKQQAIAQCFMSVRYENPGMKNAWCAGLRTADGEGEPCEVCKRCYMQHEHHRAGLGKLGG